MIWIYPRAGKKTLWSTGPFMKKWNIYARFIYPRLHSVRSLRSKLSVRFSLIRKGALFILLPRLRSNSWAWKQALKETVENTRRGYSRYPGRSSQVFCVPRGVRPGCPRCFESSGRWSRCFGGGFPCTLEITFCMAQFSSTALTSFLSTQLPSLSPFYLINPAHLT